jgi:hypothetical protein
MGMIGNYLRVSQYELEEYLSDSSKLEKKIYENNIGNDANHIDIEKSWNGIFFLLTGKSLSNIDEALPPLRWTLDAPQQIDPVQDLGYGPAYYSTITQTKEVSEALNEISTETLKSKFDGKLMSAANIYPQIWDEGDAALEYLMEHFHNLRIFYNEAVANMQAVIIYIN